MTTNTATNTALGAAVETILTARDGLLVPIGVTPSGEPLIVDLRRHPHLMLAGFAGAGKSTLLRQMVDALELQLGRDGKVLLAEGIRVGVDEAIAEVHGELLRRQHERTSNAARGPVVLCIDDFGVYAEHHQSLETLTMLRRIVNTGRASDVHLLLATQAVTGISGALLMSMSTRIVLGPVGTEHRRLFSEPEWSLVTEAGDRIGSGETGAGLLVDPEGQPATFTPLDDAGSAFTIAAVTVRHRRTRTAR
ncbi:hypothetical protein BKG79_22295 [Mycobacteroides chelonae]|uniref:FtsK/SpoIIIE domain-containing protein n=1 Tax=Mycobacteroides chelonae TaxID=1774 RepID=UPI0008A97543|nr:FtsK/SpoIIIE domain-containing protein [Mycobacteroides chelonae]OHU33339.1 hypothetical protein BKG79_22295 [Mycobacteroides chelonae]